MGGREGCFRFVGTFQGYLLQPSCSQQVTNTRTGSPAHGCHTEVSLRPRNAPHPWPPRVCVDSTAPTAPRGGL